jgi:small conductance mechanosensitive channel
VSVVLAITPLTDISVWARGDGLEVVLLVLGAVLLSRFVAWLRDRVTDRLDAARGENELVRSEASKHRHALAQILTWAATAVIWTVTLALVLDRFGVPFSSLVAPLTVGGVALGLGAQRLVLDLLSGGFIISERQYGYGDLVHISATTMTDGATGTVEDLTLRITRLRTPDGELVVIPNGQVLQVTNLSSQWARATVDVPLPVGVDVVHARELLREIGSEAIEDDELKPLLLDAPTVMGVESFEVDRVNLRMVARTLPGKQFEVARELRIRIAKAFQRDGIVTVQSPSDEHEAADH